MKVRLVKDKSGEFLILCSNGSIAKANKENLYLLLTSFHQADTISGDLLNCWNKEYPEMGMYPGVEYAMVTDAFQLVLSDFTPFQNVFTADSTNLISSGEYAKIHGKSREQIKIHCRNGRIPGVIKIARDWLIPADAPYPTPLKSGPRNNLQSSRSCIR